MLIISTSALDDLQAERSLRINLSHISQVIHSDVTSQTYPIGLLSDVTGIPTAFSLYVPSL